MKEKEAEETIVRKNIQVPVQWTWWIKTQLWILLKHLIPQAIVKDLHYSFYKK